MPPPAIYHVNLGVAVVRVAEKIGLCKSGGTGGWCEWTKRCSRNEIQSIHGAFKLTSKAPMLSDLNL